MAKHLNDIITVAYGKNPKYPRYYTFDKIILEKLRDPYKNEIENAVNSWNKDRKVRILQTINYLVENRSKSINTESICQVLYVSNEVLRTYLSQIEDDCANVT